MLAFEELRNRLSDNYSTQLGDVTSYVAPMTEIDDYGYEALDTRTQIRYVGTCYYPDVGAADRDFGWEPGRDIYNVTRIQGDFYIFTQPQDDDYKWAWYPRNVS